jgi:hypothetical protein
MFLNKSLTEEDAVPIEDTTKNNVDCVENNEDTVNYNMQCSSKVYTPSVYDLHVILEIDWFSSRPRRWTRLPLPQLGSRPSLSRTQQKIMWTVWKTMRTPWIIICNVRARYTPSVYDLHVVLEIDWFSSRPRRWTRLPLPQLGSRPSHSIIPSATGAAKIMQP